MAVGLKFVVLFGFKNTKPPGHDNELIECGLIGVYVFNCITLLPLKTQRMGWWVGWGGVHILLIVMTIDGIVITTNKCTVQ